MMTHEEILCFFSEEEVKNTVQLPDWPVGTEIVCYCRSTDSRHTIEQIAQRGGWKIVKYVHIDELPMAKLYKPVHMMFAKRGTLEWKYKSTPMELTFGDLRPSGWDKFKAKLLKGIRL